MLVLSHCERQQFAESARIEARSEAFNHLEISQRNGVCVIRILDVEIVGERLNKELQEELVRYVDSEKPSDVVIDLNGVSVLSVEGIASLLPLRERLLELGGCLTLCGVNKASLNTFARMNLADRIFKISDRIDEPERTPAFVM